MSKTLLGSIATLLVLALALAGPAAALDISNEAPTKWTDVPAGAAPGASVPNGPPSAPTGGLTFYTDRATFQADNPLLVLETYAATNAAGIVSCPDPFNSSSNDACFSPGAIVDGVEVDNLGVPPDDLNVVIPVGALGNASVLVGPNTFVTDAIISHNDPAVPVYATGVDFVCPLTAGTVNVDIYDTTGGLLGSDSSPCGAGGNFWGVASDDQIGSIETFDDDGELYANIEFGMGAVPTMSEWGMILLVTILLGISTLFVYRRRSV